jgi:hypothetical protein
VREKYLRQTMTVSEYSLTCGVPTYPRPGEEKTLYSLLEMCGMLLGVGENGIDASFSLD